MTKGYLDVGIERRVLTRRQAVFTDVVAIVRTKHELGVAQCADRAQHRHDGLSLRRR